VAGICALLREKEVDARRVHRRVPLSPQSGSALLHCYLTWPPSNTARARALLARRGFALLSGVEAAVEEEATMRGGEEEVTAGPHGARSGRRLDRRALRRGRPPSCRMPVQMRAGA
jgi:hypothetical protein